LRADLCEIASGKADKDEVIAYAKALLTRGQPLDTKPHWIFWGLAAPEALGGADARVDFLYTPTYTALAFLTRAFLMLPEEIGRLPDFTTVLRGGLLAATGRDFSGHGYESLKGVLDTLEIFNLGGMDNFVRSYPRLCPKFSRLFTKTVQGLRAALKAGKLQGMWGEEYTSRAADIFHEMDNASRTRVLVYGTLLGGNSNNRRYLAESALVGKAVLHGYSLYGLGAYPGVRENPRDAVLGEVYEVDAPTLERLNMLEDEGSLYALRSGVISFAAGPKAVAGVYVYLPEVREENYIDRKNQPWRG
jgi:gamma-glutamylcyclotransferase (GGCT)/AIG2-like uncharacterized protein YtfP